VLLAYLALYRQRRHSRAELIALLWPDAEPHLARHSLSQALSALRQILEPPGTPFGAVLRVDHELVELNRDAVSTDVSALEAALKAAKPAHGPQREARLAAAIEAYTGELLPGCFEQWAFLERQRLADAVLEAYEALIALREKSGEVSAAIDLARSALSIDPLRETMYGHLIRLLTRAGRAAEARRQARELKRRLSDGSNASNREAATPARETGARRSDPPAAPETGGRTLLPSYPTRFFDREVETARLTALLGGANPCRLVTLTGPGGSGKTRLAVEAAWHLTETWDDALCFVPLSEHEGLTEAIRDALGLHRSGKRDPKDQIVAALSARPTLLLLDNFEHLVDDGASIVRELLERVPTLTCLVTSRRRLGVAGERELPVKPLQQAPSVQLFVDRAEAANAEFALTEENRADVTALCTRLEGIPLAIELAAARSTVLTPHQMLDHLSARFSLLVSTNRDAPQRHRSLRAALEWSVRMLPPESQRFLARLSVFRGGWSEAGARAVCEEPLALDHLARLRDDSLLLTETVDDVIRFRMFETIREFVEEQLSATEREAAERRHLEYFLALAERAAPELQGPDAARWLDRLEREHKNLRAALSHALEAAPALAIRLGASLWRFWQVRGYVTEGRRSLQQLLGLPEAGSGAERARLLDGAADLATDQGDFSTAREQFTEALAIWRDLGDRAGMTFPIYGLANLALYEGRQDESRALFEENLALQQEIGDLRGQAISLSNLGGLAMPRGEIERATELLTQSLALQRALGDRESAGYTLVKLARIALAHRDPGDARAHLEEALRIFRDLDCQDGIAGATGVLAQVAIEEGSFEEARRCCEEALRRYRELGSHRRIIQCVHWLGVISLEQGRLESASSFLREALALAKEAGDEAIVTSALAHLEGLARVKQNGMGLHRPLTPARTPGTSAPIAPAGNASFAELTDIQWARIRPVLSPPNQDVGRPRADDRCALDGIRYVLYSGCAWNALPRRYGSPSTCWRRWKQWQAAGAWPQIEAELRV
jgi:predicted ATPase/DNA-binding SARP family transcriptional activator/Tfp pilus assembly protein PilF